jgi:CBS domain-containing protein
MSLTFTDAARRRVGDIMTKTVVKVHPDTPVSQIAHLMSEHDVSGLPVVDDQDRVLGVITELDLIIRNARFKLPTFFMILDQIVYLETPQHQKRLEHMLGATAKEIMSKPARTIAPDATIDKLAELMVEERMNPIPVVENDRLVGIVSRSDIVHLMARESEDER